MNATDISFYWFGPSPPSRAVKTFMDCNHIPYKATHFDMWKQEHKNPEFLKVNPRGQVPVVVDDGFILTERYLATTRSVPTHWYPADPKLRARVDELMDWHHTNLRIAGSECLGIGVVSRFGAPKSPLNKEGFEKATKKLSEQYAFVEQKVKVTKFVTGDEISIADLLLACEIELYKVFNIDLSGMPDLVSWLKRVRETPGYTENDAAFDGFVQHIRNNFAW